MNRREVLKATSGAGLLLAAGVSAAGPSSYRRIEVSRDRGPYVEREFETLIAGDRFRIVFPADQADGCVYTCHGGAQRVPGEPGNWSVPVSAHEWPEVIK